MFTDAGVYASFAVKDVETSREFYGQTLGLNVRDEMGMLFLELPSGGQIMLYPKEDHEAAAFTVLNVPVTDVEQAVADLKAKGVVFESYDGEFGTDENNISDGSFYGGPKIAWFRDPSGNILAVLNTG